MVCGSRINFGYRGIVARVLPCTIDATPNPQSLAQVSQPVTVHSWVLKSPLQKVMRLKHEATAPESLHIRNSDARALLSLPSSRHNLLTGCQSPQYPLPAVKNLITFAAKFFVALVTSPTQRPYWRDLSLTTPPVAPSRDLLA